MNAPRTFRYRARFVRALDADSLRLMVDLGFGARHEFDLRLAGVNAPEMGTMEGEDALVAVLTLMADHAVPIRGDAGGWPLVAATHRRESGVEVRSFARYVGTLEIVGETGESIDVGGWLVAGGYASRVGA